MSFMLHSARHVRFRRQQASKASSVDSKEVGPQYFGKVEATFMKTQWSWLPIACFVLVFSAYGQEAIHPGTTIPVALSATLSSGKTKPGTAISARVMQDVPLPNGRKIKEGRKVMGHVIEVRPATSGAGASISLAVDRVLVSKPGVPVETDLRAMASVVAVEDAMIPAFGMGESMSWSARTTTQVGGDLVYWGGGPVVSRFGPVGKPVDGGANSGVLVKVTAAPGSPCRGEIDDNHSVQALWVFSSDACGVYGLNDVTITHAGRDEPVGVIELSSTSGQLKVPSGTGMLLRVVTQ
jgi:hypothetical protein